MRFNEFDPLIERQRPQLPKNARVTRAARPVTPAPTAPISSTPPDQTTPTPTSPQQPGTIRQIRKPPNTIGNQLSNAINNQLKPGLAQIGSAFRQGINTFKQGAVDRETDEIFRKKFLQQLEYNRQTAQQRGMTFNLQGFIDGYMARNKWSPGKFETQLKQAIAKNDLYNLPKVMSQIGKENTVIYSPNREREVASSFNDTSTQANAPEQPKQPAPPLIFGGKTIDPSSPLYAKVLSMMQQQGVV